MEYSPEPEWLTDEPLLSSSLSVESAIPVLVDVVVSLLSFWLSEITVVLFSVCQRFFTELSVLPPRYLAIYASAL